ncbi:MAG TPA: ammonium transporter [Tepidisphaeraceae bacterium]|nr:ammonium transporter [Tepidisphaeraceae bacterium]
MSRSHRALLIQLFLLLLLVCIAAPRAAAQSEFRSFNPVAAEMAEHTRSINFVWTLIAGFLVMFMQAGFALMETGLCRAKNAAHTMSMNFLVYSIAMMAFFVCGFAFMCGGVNGVPGGPGGPVGLGLNTSTLPVLNHMVSIPIGGKQWGIFGFSGFFLTGNVSKLAGALIWFFYMMVFMDTAATIPTGALAERWKFRNFAIFSACVGGFIYSAYGCWMWGGGWLSQLGRQAGLGHGAVDFAGSSVVHLQGGAMALAMVVQIGPRIGKYDEDGNPRPIFGHHMPMVMFGTLLMAFCWFGFNAGSTLAGVSSRIGLIAVNTMLASGASVVVAAIYMWKVYGKPDPSMMCNGMLGGLVAITASCAFVAPISAVIIGLVAGLIVVLSVLTMEKRGIDDPVGAISVHGVAGLWGLLAVGLFADGTWPTEGFNGVSGGVRGLFYGDGKQLLAQLIAAAVCIGWCLIVGGGVFKLIGMIVGSNRVSPEVELAGLDIPEMGAPGYPEFITNMSMEQVSHSEVIAARSKMR